ncbi:MAG: PAS domain S-box [Solidesulfovibrio magneticus str. Maddingley MBC34]|uniref:Sensory/regulatory protein RpfC n=1 Tax=Solidesulfovibrio magneticus str. Maddingley MBC34 TaxID=1206767 RepID=K6GCU1_9BACT|nr:MAG: PAS domain S-box [Solidesulfovibrio magneticus str. Maddingley MBC34]
MSFTRRPPPNRPSRPSRRRAAAPPASRPGRAGQSASPDKRLGRLTSIIAALDQAIAFIAPSGVIAEINDRYLAWLGRSRADVLGAPLDVLDLDTEDYQAAAFLDLFRRGVAQAPVSFESRIGARDVTVKLQPVIENGAFAGLIVSLIDVTPLVEARLGVEREKRFLEQVITIAGAAICIVNRDDVVVTINDEFTAITGYTRDQALGRPRAQLLRESPLSPCPAAPGDAAVQKRQSTIAARGGKRLTILKNAAPILGADGQITGGIESFVDVSDLIRARVQAEEASRMKSAFLANMSHEIRTPLNAIMGLSQLLLRANLPAQQRECVETMRAAGEGLLVILNDILDFSRIEMGRLEIRPAPMDIDRLLEEVRRVMAQSADQQGLPLTIERDPALPRVVLCDPVRLKQILLNLLSNAIKFTPNGRVTLSAKRASGSLADDGPTRVTFAVRDTGPGITPEVRERIFEPFVQTEDAMTRNPGGTGLGLSISNRLVGLLGGSGLELDSAPGLGSVFAFTLPLPEPLAAHPRHDLPLPPAADFGGLRALVAEDNPYNRFLLQKILQKLGVGQADFASDGQEAVRMVLDARDADAPYHVIFMDVRMPILDGLEAARSLREYGVTTPIIALTAQAAEDDNAQCRQAGMNAYFSKPYRINDIEAVLAEIAANRTAS